MAKARTPVDDLLDAVAVVSVPPTGRPAFWSITLVGKQAEAVRQRARERGITEVQAFAELLQEEKKP